MSNNAAKPASSKSAKPPLALASPKSPGSVAETENSGSKPDARSGCSPLPMTAEARRAMIAEAAYYIAEQRGFICGREGEDWLLAEKQIDSALSREARGFCV